MSSSSSISSSISCSGSSISRIRMISRIISSSCRIVISIRMCSISSNRIIIISSSSSSSMIRSRIISSSILCSGSMSYVVAVGVCIVVVVFVL